MFYVYCVLYGSVIKELYILFNSVKKRRHQMLMKLQNRMVRLLLVKYWCICIVIQLLTLMKLTSGFINPEDLIIIFTEANRLIIPDVNWYQNSITVLLNAFKIFIRHHCTLKSYGGNIQLLIKQCMHIGHHMIRSQYL